MIDAGVNPVAARTLIVGFSEAARRAAQILLRQGQPCASILVVTNDADQAAVAAALGLPSRTEALPDGLDALLDRKMTKVIVDVGNDDVAEKIIRLVRRRLRGTVILVRGTTPGALARLLASGASEAFCDASIAGKLLAATADALPHPPGLRLD